MKKANNKKMADDLRPEYDLSKLKGGVRGKYSFPPENYRLAERIALFKFIYSMTGLFLGLICMLGGIVLFLHGVTGSTSWTAKIFGNESTISDAAPGAILFIVGLFIVVVTRFRAVLDRKKGDTREHISMYSPPFVR